MRFIPLVLSLLWILYISQASSEPARVAIIGAGIGGAATAYHLRDLPCHIDLYEAGAVGGRAQDFTYESKVMERGGAMIWEHNMHLANAAKELGLKTKLLGSGGLSIYDGTSIVFSTSSSWTDPFKIVGRYGLSPIVYGRHAMKVWREHFSPIYDLQQKMVAFNSPKEMLERMGLYGLSQLSCTDHAKDVLMPWSMWGSESFMEEMVAAVNRCNYNQKNAQMNALAGLVSFLPVAGGSVWAFEEGNGKVATAMINASGATLKAPCTVSTVTTGADGRFNISSTCSAGTEGSQGPYDAVVIAAPLELSNLTFQLPERLPKINSNSVRPGEEGDCSASMHAKDFSSPSWNSLCSWVRCEGYANEAAEDEDIRTIKRSSPGPSPHSSRKFQKTIATFLQGRMQHAYFGGSEKMPETIFLTEKAVAPFSAISLKYRGRDMNLYKVFSTEPLQDSFLGEAFGPSYKVVSVDYWDAYPEFSPPEEFAPFVLAPGMFYNNAIENAASAMEMSFIAGINSALLVRQRLEKMRET